MVANKRIDTSFGRHLIEEGLLSKEVLDDALHQSQILKKPLIQFLLDTQGIDSQRLYQLFSQQLDVPFQSLKGFIVPEAVAARVPIKFCTHYKFAPISINKDVLTLASSYPMNLKTRDEIKLQLGIEIYQVLALKSEIDEVLRKSYGMAAGTINRIVSQSRSIDEDGSKFEVSDIGTADQAAMDGTVINLVNQILLEAYRKRATDVHLEPYRGHFRLRYRIDGVLQDANLSGEAKKLILPIISRIKIMSNLDIVEHRLPQDGRSMVRIGDQKLDLRVSSIPTPYGESIVIRVLKTELTFDLSKLGLSNENASILRTLITEPNGIILLTGPTGSGKTTTLYTCLNQIKSDKLKIISLEDPIEYDLPGITQIQVQTKVGLDFAGGLRSMLRHDPDIMMVGEIRDLETAEIAIRAALTGHLIFSTLHTNDAASGVTRLLDIGVEKFLVASSVRALIAQRLVRVICDHCKVQDNDVNSTLKQKIQIDLGISETLQVFKGSGCSHCNHTGYYGRTAIHELLLMSDTLRQLILGDASAVEIKKAAIKSGMKTLLIDGWKKVAAGVTTVQEVINVAGVTEI